MSSILTSSTYDGSDEIGGGLRSEEGVTVRLAGDRLHYLDALRAIAMLAGVFLHAGLAYSVMFNHGYVAANTTGSYIADFLLWLVHTFRMPLFFIISGFFTHYLLEKRGTKGFLKNRALRIGLPLVVFWPLIMASIFGVIGYAIMSMGLDNPVAKMIKISMENPEAAQAQKPPIGTVHLWFIYYLIFFCGFTVLAQKFLILSDRLVDFLVSPVAWLLVFPLLTLPALLTQPMPHPAPESFIPAFWSFGYYGLFFFAGWVFYRNQGMLDRMHKFWPLMGIVSIGMYGIFFALQTKEPIELEVLVAGMQKFPEMTWKHAVTVVATAILSWHLSILSLLAARKYLSAPNRAFRYISDASYWIYIVHVPFVLFFQAYFYTTEWPILIEFSITSIASLFLGFVTYAILVRHTPIGWMLNGRRKNKEN